MALAENNPAFDDDSEEEFDWEEVEVPEQQHLEITIQAASNSRQKTDTTHKKKGISHAERLVRIDCHKIHTVSLLGNAWIRNKWINDPLLHARLLSLTPLALQNAFGMIHKSRVPDQNQRGRMFENAITNLAEWWSNSFFDVTIDGHIRNRTYDEVQTKLMSKGFISQNANIELELEDIQDVLGCDWETIRSSKSLMKHALMQSGSRDTSAQLFTSLCRALSIPARLVVSLQSVPWQTGVGKPKPTYSRKSKGKGKAKANGGGDEDEDVMEEVDIPTSTSATVSEFETKGRDKGKDKEFVGTGQRLDGGAVLPKSDKAKGKERATPVIKLRKAKDKGRVLGTHLDSPTSASSSRLASPDPITTPPVFWTEVFSRPDARWIPVDCIRCIVNKRKAFDPTPSSTPTTQPGSAVYPHPYALNAPNKKNTGRFLKQENRMVYVLAFEEDGYARDVTRRYAKEYSAKVAKVQGGSSTIGGGGKGRQAWWEKVVNSVSRPYRLHRDDVEDEELEAAQMNEGMPTTISGFKDHPIYVLTRHLKQNQVIDPPPPDTKELGKFRGEPVYPRSSVVSLKTAENWMRSEGRSVKEGSQALKFVKIRAATVGRMRELEVLKDELREAGEQAAVGSVGSNGKPAGDIMQGLYARNQTELYIPDPVVDGKVPKNNFGNIDLYVPSMLPQGAVHVPFKGTAKIARKLGFDYAEAVTGFEFKKRRAFPIVEGVVIAQDNEAVLLEAYWEAEQDAEEKARLKREERVIKQWTRLVQGLHIRQRLQEQYASTPREEQEVSGEASLPPKENMAGEGGGFIVGADDVVEAFHLPKYQHTILPFSSAVTATSAKNDARVTPAQEGYAHDPPKNFTYDLHTMEADYDAALEQVPTTPIADMAAPRTMRQMAEDAARLYIDNDNPSHRSGDGTIDAAYRSTSIPTSDKNEIPTMKITLPPRVKLGKPLDNQADVSVKQKSRPATPRRTSTRKRSRAVEGSHSSDEEAQSSPKKMKGKSGLPTPVPSTRTLRPRASKTAAQLAEERDQERAYRRATAR